MTTKNTNLTEAKRKEAAMKPMNKTAQKTFAKLIAPLTEENPHRKIGKAGGAFMQVSVERLYQIEAGTIFSVAHYYEQNGDLMADPDMTFLLSSVDGRVYPLTFKQDSLGIYRESVVWEDGKIKGVRPRMQADQAVFSGQWMKNIKFQQAI